MVYGRSRKLERSKRKLIVTQCQSLSAAPPPQVAAGLPEAVVLEEPLRSLLLQQGYHWARAARGRVSQPIAFRYTLIEHKRNENDKIIIIYIFHIRTRKVRTLTAISHSEICTEKNWRLPVSKLPDTQCNSLCFAIAYQDAQLRVSRLHTPLGTLLKTVRYASRWFSSPLFVGLWDLTLM